jgi:hypothetical protein
MDRLYYDESVLRYHVAFYLPHAMGEMVVAEALDFPGAVTQGFDLPDAQVLSRISHSRFWKKESHYRRRQPIRLLPTPI